MRIRRLGAGDEPILAALAASTDFDLPGRGEPELPLGDVEAAAYLADANVRHWVAEEDGEVVGELLAHLLRLPHAPGPELLLYSIGVHAAARRRGVGRALVAALAAHARAERIGVIWVLADNPDAEEFYVACGFRRGEDDEQGLLMLLEHEV